MEWKIEPRESAACVAFDLRPFACYRLRYAWRSAGPAYRVVDFFAADGERLYADNYSGLDSSADWQTGEGVFFAPAEAACGMVGFRAIDHRLEVREVDVSALSRPAARAWMQELGRQLPAIPAAGPAAAWPGLESLRARLTAGGTVRWVALGDSLANDLLNSLAHLWLEEAFPQAELQMIHACGPQKSAAGYNDEDILRQLVYRQRPQVLMVAGMSHTGQVEAIREVIARSRAACGELDALYVHVNVKATTDCPEAAAFLCQLAVAGAADGFAVRDLSAPWRAFLRRSPASQAWYMRDHCHLNDRGKQVLGRLFAACLPG